MSAGDWIALVALPFTIGSVLFTIWYRLRRRKHLTRPLPTDMPLTTHRWTRVIATVVILILAVISITPLVVGHRGGDSALEETPSSEPGDQSTYNFEQGPQGWRIDRDISGAAQGSDIAVTTTHKHAGRYSLTFHGTLVPQYPGTTRSGVARVVVDHPLAPGQGALAQIYAPTGAPTNLAARLFVEDRDGYVLAENQMPLEPNTWKSLVVILINPDQLGATGSTIGVEFLLTDPSLAGAAGLWESWFYIDDIEILDLGALDTHGITGKATPGLESIDAPPTMPPTITPGAAVPSSGVCTKAYPRAETADSWMYIVSAGNDLEGLALLFYRDNKRWRDIYEANRGVIGDLITEDSPPPIYEGQRLLIPGIGGPLLYSVREGDTLQGIATLVYGPILGSSRLWCRIWLDNLEVIGPDPRRMRPGQQLHIYPLHVPTPTEHIVYPGDMLESITEAYNIASWRAEIVCEASLYLWPQCGKLEAFDLVTLLDLDTPLEYKVVAGDTVASIALRCYGSEDKGTRIHITNRGVIGDNVEWLHAGQELRLYGCTF